MQSFLPDRPVKSFWGSLFFKTVCAKHLCEACRLPVPKMIFWARAAVGCAQAALPLTVGGVSLKASLDDDCWYPLNGCQPGNQELFTMKQAGYHFLKVLFELACLSAYARQETQ